MKLKILKKNYIIIFVVAFALMVAGYLNYNNENINTIATANLKDSSEMAEIGDAVLVNTQQTEVSSEMNEELEKSEKIDITNEYFVNSRLERETMYSQMLESYQKILESDVISSEQKNVAEQEIVKINNIKNAIMISENLIKNKDVKDVIIFVNGESISVIVDVEILEDVLIAQIQNIIEREMKVDLNNVHISRVIK